MLVVLPAPGTSVSCYTTGTSPIVSKFVSYLFGCGYYKTLFNGPFGQQHGGYLENMILKIMPCHPEFIHLIDLS